MFDSTKENLDSLLESINKGKLQLPDFQRDWVWSDEDIRSLLASIGRGFPIGALLTLRTGGDVNFKPRPLAHAPTDNTDPEELLLDGQQRLTSLFQALQSTEPVQTKNSKDKELSLYYYVDMQAAVASDARLEPSIIAVPENRILKKTAARETSLDLSTDEAAYEHHMFPLNLTFNSKKWFNGYHKYWQQKGVDGFAVTDPFDAAVLDRIEKYQLPIIRLSAENTRQAICTVFEKVNVGGKKLDAFELLTAIFAADEYDLRVDMLGDGDEKVRGRLNRLRRGATQQEVFDNMSARDFLQVCVLIQTWRRRQDAVEEGKSGKQLPAVNINADALLEFKVEVYKDVNDSVEAGFVEAGKFFNGQMILRSWDVPYLPQSKTLAALYVLLGKGAHTIPAQEKLERWFWSVTFGESYGASTDSKISRDALELFAWIKEDGPVPRTVEEADFRLDRLDTMRSRNSAAYKGLHALLMRDGCRDFVSGKPVELMTFHNEDIDIHHIFPVKWCEANSIPRDQYNSIVNKTALSARTNRIIGGAAPSEYLKTVQSKFKVEESALDDALKSHHIDPAQLRSDNFDAFFQARKAALASLIGERMGKPVNLSETDADEDEIDDLVVMPMSEVA